MDWDLLDCFEFRGFPRQLIDVVFTRLELYFLHHDVAGWYSKIANAQGYNYLL